MKSKLILLATCICILSCSEIYGQSAVGVNIARENKAIVNRGGTIKLYPLPAKTYTNIYIEWAEMQPFSVTIYDMYDIQIQLWNEKATKSYQKALFVTQLPPGNYYLVARGTKGILKENFTVER